MEQKHLYSSDDKIKWFGYGEWVEEPDWIEFIHCGLKCKIRRVVIKEPGEQHSFGGYLCGYVRIPDNHPWTFSEDNRDICAEVHGGVTYGTMEEDGFWVGFDCAHSGDLTPSMELFFKEESIKKRRQDMIEKYPESKDILLKISQTTYRNVFYAMEQVKHLAEQARESMEKIKGDA